MTDSDTGMLAPYRVLDLTDETGQPCGKLLADLGADVIKIEPPGGDPARRRGPFVDDEPDLERSLYWLAYNANKRSLTLDLGAATDRARFKRLAASADVVIESFAPGRLAALGLGYAALATINPGLVLVSISPFGQHGPYRDYKAPDIVIWAMSGLMSIAGETEGPPAHLSDNAQSYMAVSGDAAIGALLALEQRRQTGHGQHVDVSMQEAVIRSTFQITASWDMLGRNLPRDNRPVTTKLQWMWPCRDGHVLWIFSVGPGARDRKAGFFTWLQETGQGAALLEMDWDRLQPDTMSTAEWNAISNATRQLFSNFTKAELYEAAITHRFTLYPSATMDETLANQQLLARGFWQDLEHPQLGRTVRYPGAFAKATLTPPRVRRRAPLLGEHSREILAELDASHAGAAQAEGSTGPDDQPEPAQSKPLAGLRVVDFSWFMVGPMTTKALADYGADVVHVESSTRIDAQRTSGPFKDGERDPERCGDYAQVRTNQRSITLDLKHPTGIGVAKRLAAWADIVFDNFAAGTMQRLGLGYEALRAINPRIIVLSSCGQGQDGPHAGSKGGGGHYAALSGFNELAGSPGAEPGYLSTYTDFIAPRFNVSLLLAALDYRRRSGMGQFFDVSQYETAMHWLAPSLLDYAVNGRVAGRHGNHQALAAPHGAYRCRAGRWCAIAVRSEREWQAFRSAIGNPSWASEARFASLEGRKQHEGELDSRVEQWTLERESQQVMQTLQVAGVPAGAVQRGEELLEHDPQIKHRGFWQTLDHPVLGRHHVPQHAFRLPDAPCELRRSRLIGEDTHEVLREVVGMSEEEIADLAIAGILQ